MGDKQQRPGCARLRKWGVLRGDKQTSGKPGQAVAPTYRAVLGNDNLEGRFQLDESRQAQLHRREPRLVGRDQSWTTLKS